MLDGVYAGHDARLAVAVGGDDTVGQYLLTSPACRLPVGNGDNRA